MHSRSAAMLHDPLSEPVVLSTSRRLDGRSIRCLNGHSWPLLHVWQVGCPPLPTGTEARTDASSTMIEGSKSSSWTSWQPRNQVLNRALIPECPCTRGTPRLKHVMQVLSEVRDDGRSRTTGDLDGHYRRAVGACQTSPDWRCVQQRRRRIDPPRNPETESESTHQATADATNVVVV